jgi:hypothetical protein
VRKDDIDIREELNKFWQLKREQTQARENFEMDRQKGVTSFERELEWEKIADQIGDSLFAVANRLIARPATNIAEIYAKAEVLRDYTSGTDTDIIEWGARTICDDILAFCTNRRILKLH